MLEKVIEAFAEIAAPYKPDLVAGVDARGFLFVTPLALALGSGAMMLRKPGKLPGALDSVSYALEYGNASLTMQQDRDLASKTVILIDDLLATGGTLAAAEQLISRRAGKLAAVLVLIELTGLKGRQQLAAPVHSLQCYEY